MPIKQVVSSVEVAPNLAASFPPTRKDEIFPRNALAFLDPIESRAAERGKVGARYRTLKSHRPVVIAGSKLSPLRSRPPSIISPLHAPRRHRPRRRRRRRHCRRGARRRLALHARGKWVRSITRRGIEGGNTSASGISARARRAAKKGGFGIYSGSVYLSLSRLSFQSPSTPCDFTNTRLLRAPRTTLRNIWWDFFGYRGLR